MVSARTTPASKLPRGATALDRATVAAVHRERLQRAALEVVAREGYADATVAQIARHARVSTNAFYAQHGGKQDCFSTAWEGEREQLERRLDEAAGGGPAPASLREALAAVFAALVGAVADDPEGSRALIVGVLAVGPGGPRCRRRLAAGLERALRTAADRVEHRGLSDLALRLVAGGTLQVLDQRLRADPPRFPRTLAPDLAAWACSYESDRTLDLPPAALEAPPTAEVEPADADAAHLVRLPRGHNKLPRAFVAQHQRRRILHAVAQQAREHGYGGVTVPQIAAAAHISNRTFYEHFADKGEAFLAAFDAAFARLFSRVFYTAAQHEDWPRAVREGVGAWLDALAAEPELARFGFSDVLTASDAGPKMEEALQAFAHLLGHGFDLPPGGCDPPEIVPYAVAGGIASLVGDWAEQGRIADLRALGPQLTYLALAPFVGDEAAARQAA